MSGATAQVFIHENTPHVCSMFDFPDIKVFTESWTEIRQFIRNIDEDVAIFTKTEKIHWDGSRERIADTAYTAIAPDQVTLEIDKSNQSYAKR